MKAIKTNHVNMVRVLVWQHSNDHEIKKASNGLVTTRTVNNTEELLEVAAKVAMSE